MPPVLLTKRIEFAASHRYGRPEWDDEKNRTVFGRCYNPPAHGHNYLLELTVSGEIDQKTGMVVNLFDLKRVLLDVIEEFDHKNLNLDVDFMRGKMCSIENLVMGIWNELKPLLPGSVTLHCIKLVETPRIYVEYYG